MDAALQNLKGINCPKGNACASARCPLSHPSQLNVVGLDGAANDSTGGHKRRREVLPSENCAALESGIGKRSKTSSANDYSNPPLDLPRTPALQPLMTETVIGNKCTASSFGIRSNAVNPPLANLPSDSGAWAGAHEPRDQSRAFPKTVNKMPDKGVGINKPSAFSQPKLISGAATAVGSCKRASAPVNQSLDSVTAIVHEHTRKSPLCHQTVVLNKSTKTHTEENIKANENERKETIVHETLTPRHVVPAPAPYEVRHVVLLKLHEQYKRLNEEMAKDLTSSSFALSAQQLVRLANDFEETVARERRSIYKNVMGSTIVKYKKMKVDEWKNEHKSKSRGEEREIGSKATSPSTTAVQETFGLGELSTSSTMKTGLTPDQEVEGARKIAAHNDQLIQYQYVVKLPTVHEILQAKQALAESNNWESCTRCSRRFQVFTERREDGALTTGGSCTYHHGRRYKVSCVGGPPDSRLNCCHQSPDSHGCVRHDHHVFKVDNAARLAAVMPFKETPRNPAAPQNRAVAIDCEMAHTVHGMELIRLTAISWPDGTELLDVLVKPLGVILDLNSRYSGVWSQDFVRAEPYDKAKHGADAKKKAMQTPITDTEGGEEGQNKYRGDCLPIVKSPDAARELLFQLIAPDTPLIGHGLENDLNALRIVHLVICDSAILYPRAKGSAMRHSLKHLMQAELNTTIQAESGEKGHDSAEDARAAGELVRLKVGRVKESRLDSCENIRLS